MHIFHRLFHTPAFLKESLAKNFVQSFALLLGMPPCGAGETDVPFCLPKKEPKRHQGVWLRRTSRQRRVFIVATPGPHLRECVPLDRQFVPAGKIKICSCSILGPQGPSAIQIWAFLCSNAHRLVQPYLFGAAVVGWTNCHGYARLGGVISAQYPPNFAYKGPKARGKWYYRTCFRTAGKLMLRNQEGVSRNGGPGGGLTMSASKGAALIGRTPLGDSLVPF